MTTVYLSLGSNLGDRRRQLEVGLAALEARGVRIVRRSSLYETEPVGFQDQPWFLNLVAQAETDLPPDALLAVLHEVEAAAGRVRAVRWGPRTLDIDILLYDQLVVHSDRLRVPHPELAGRRFVLEPLAEIAPDLRLPDGRAVRDLLAALEPGLEVSRIGEIAEPPVRVRRARTSQGFLLPPGRRGRFLSVEGPIGVGKTTLARRLAGRLGAGLLLEVVEENPFLQTFYQDIRGRAFPTQLFFLLSRHKQLQQIGGRLTGGADVVADYMFAKDRLFAGLTLDEAELALYEAVYTLIAPHVPHPTAVIYLRASVPVLLERIAARRRPFERDITAGYLDRLARAYDAHFDAVEDIPVIVVDSERVDPRRDIDLADIAEALAGVLVNE